MRQTQRTVQLIGVVMCIALLGACATVTTGPVPAGDDTFLISKQEGALPWDRKPLLPEAVAEANKHCVSLGKTMKVVSTNETPSPIGKATLVFSCLQRWRTGSEPNDGAPKILRAKKNHD